MIKKVEKENLANVLHIIGILLICNCYLQLREKTKDKYRYIKILIISIVASLIIYGIENQTIALIIYLLCIGIILKICYLENNKKIIVCAIWVSIIVETIDMISILLVNTVNKVMSYYNGSLENILVKDIIYIETNGRGSIINMIDRCYECSEKINDLEIKLEEYGFFKCHKSFLINLNAVEQLDKKFVYFGGDKKAYISVRKYTETKKRYIEAKKKFASM